MVKRSSKGRKRAKSNAAAVDTGEKNPAAVALGRLGGKAGGKAGGNARAQSLSAKRRKEIAKKAANARWKKQNDTP